MPILMQRTPRPTHSPWGPVNEADEIMNGMWRVYTPEHGGIILSSQRVQLVPFIYLQSTFDRQGWDGFFEEDCDMAIPLLVFEFEYRQYLSNTGASFDQINEFMQLISQEVHRLVSNQHQLVL